MLFSSTSSIHSFFSSFVSLHQAELFVSVSIMSFFSSSLCWYQEEKTWERRTSEEEDKKKFKIHRTRESERTKVKNVQQLKEIMRWNKLYNTKFHREGERGRGDAWEFLYWARLEATIRSFVFCWRAHNNVSEKRAQEAAHLSWKMIISLLFQFVCACDENVSSNYVCSSAMEAVHRWHWRTREEYFDRYRSMWYRVDLMYW